MAKMDGVITVVKLLGNLVLFQEYYQFTSKSFNQVSQLYRLQQRLLLEVSLFMLPKMKMDVFVMKIVLVVLVYHQINVLVVSVAYF